MTERQGDHTLEVTDLRVSRGATTIIEALDFALGASESLAVFGRSGSGKSSAALAMLGLLDGATMSGSVRLSGTELNGLGSDELRALTARHVGFMFESSKQGLEPVARVDRMLTRALRRRRVVPWRTAPARVQETLRELDCIPGAERWHVHQLSRTERALLRLARALSGHPALLIADEPLRELDYHARAEVVDALTRRQQAGMALLVLTSDAATVAELCGTVVVLDDGRCVERGPTSDVLGAPTNAATRALVSPLEEQTA